MRLDDLPDVIAFQLCYRFTFISDKQGQRIHRLFAIGCNTMNGNILPVKIGLIYFCGHKPVHEIESHDACKRIFADESVGSAVVARIIDPLMHVLRDRVWIFCRSVIGTGIVEDPRILSYLFCPIVSIHRPIGISIDLAKQSCPDISLLIGEAPAPVILCPYLIVSALGREG